MNAIPTKGRPSKTREAAAADLAKGTWEGTEALVLTLANESTHARGFRPLRAAVLAAIRDIKPVSGEEPIYMTATEFTAWRVTAKAVALAREDGNYLDRIDISDFQARKYAREGAPKIIALACAHYLLGLPLPIQPDDPRAFEEWFRPRFGGTERVAEWMQVSAAWLGNRMNGFEILKGQRIERVPSVSLIRALDWLSIVGPVCPYGEKTPLVLWPGQDLSEGY